MKNPSLVAVGEGPGGFDPINEIWAGWIIATTNRSSRRFVIIQQSSLTTALSYDVVRHTTTRPRGRRAYHSLIGAGDKLRRVENKTLAMGFVVIHYSL
jgi:hypothetical protein